MNAPPNALRSTTVIFGTEASANACTSLAPWRITPPCSCLVPGMKPGVSTSTISGRPKRVAGAHEARALGGRLGVEHAAEVARLVGDHADAAAVDAGEAAHDVARPALAVLEQAAAVDDAADDVAHVVDLALVLRHRRRRRRSRRAPRSASAARARCRSWAGGRAGRARAAPRRRRPRRRSARRRCSRGPCGRRGRRRVTSSPMTSRTTAGPVRNMFPRSVMTTKSVSAGE